MVTDKILKILQQYYDEVDEKYQDIDPDNEEAYLAIASKRSEIYEAIETFKELDERF